MDYTVHLTRLFAALVLMLSFAASAETTTTTVKLDKRDQLQQAKALFDSGRARGAYRLLLPLEKEYAGFPEFDYLLGIAALDADIPGYAVVALQRVIAVEPLFVGARIDLARAYFYLREFDSSRQEFETVLRFNPPSQVRELVVRYLDEIYKRQKGPRRHFGFAINGTVGNDSNANNASEVTVINDFQLNESSIKTPSTYVGIGGQANFAQQTSSRSTLYLGADIEKRLFLDAEFVNTQIVGANISTNYFARYFSMNMGGQLFHTNTDDTYKTYNAVGVGQFQFMLGRFIKSALVGRAAVSEHQGELSDQDSYSAQGIASIGLARDFGIIPATDVSFILGKTIARHAGSPYGNDQYGVRFKGIKPVTSKWRLMGTSGALWTRYGIFDGTNVRNDRRLDATASIQWRPSKGFMLSPSVSYIHHSSTINIYNYRKLDYHLKFRKEF